MTTQKNQPQKTIISRFIAFMMLIMMFYACTDQEAAESYRGENTKIDKEQIESQLKEFEHRAKKEEWTFKTGYNKTIQYSLKELARLELPENWMEIAAEQNEFAHKIVQIDHELFGDYYGKIFGACFA